MLCLREDDLSRLRFPVKVNEGARTVDETWLIRFSGHLTGPVSTSASHWSGSAPAPPTCSGCKPGLSHSSLISLRVQTSIKRAPCFKSLQAIDYFNHLESGILTYTKASLVVSTVPASTSKKTATLPRTKEWSLKGITSLFSLSDLEGQAHSS